MHGFILRTYESNVFQISMRVFIILYIIFNFVCSVEGVTFFLGSIGPHSYTVIYFCENVFSISSS